ncbi:MAG: FtsK/SpoIIIE domain-containing protein [Chloroflexota bacterium]
MNTLQTELGILRRDVLQAEQVAARVQATLLQRGLTPAFRGHYLTRLGGILILVSELDTARLDRMERYASGDLLHHISTNLEGLKVYLSNTTGLRYVFPLSKPRGLPKRIEFPQDAERGKLSLGVNYSGRRVAVEWGDLGHVLVAGMTGSGKSMLLRLIVWQAVRDGMGLLIADIDQATFPMLAGHPALRAPLGRNAAEAFDLIRQALAECDRRAALFQAMPGYPENLDEYNRLAVKHGKEPLPRLLLVLDEFSATLSALGGGKGEAGQWLAAIGFRGRKFGLSILFAAHEFTKEQVGLLRDQVRTVVMLRVQSKEMAKRLGCEGAERISVQRPGLAVSNRWGPLQTYFLEKGALVGGTKSVAAQTSPTEATIFSLAQEHDGLVTRERVMQWGGVSEWQARKWMEAWALRGWIAKDPKRNNAFVVAKMPDSLSNHPTAPTAPTALQPAAGGEIHSPTTPTALQAAGEHEITK